MGESTCFNENILKKAIEKWSNFKLKQYYQEYRESVCFIPTLYDIPQEFKDAAFILVKTEMTVRGLLS